MQGRASCPYAHGRAPTCSACASGISGVGPLQMRVQRRPCILFLAWLINCSPKRGEDMTAENTSTGLSTSSDSSGLLDNPTSTDMTPTSSTTSTTGKDDVTSSGEKSEETSAEDECLGTPKNADLGTSPIECDIWEQDCGAGEKCTPYFWDGESWGGHKCVPVAHEPVSVGEPCTIICKFGDGVDTCEKGSLCWNIDSSTAGTCVSLCTGTPFCPQVQ